MSSLLLEVPFSFLANSFYPYDYSCVPGPSLCFRTRESRRVNEYSLLSASCLPHQESPACTFLNERYKEDRLKKSTQTSKQITSIKTISRNKASLLSEAYSLTLFTEESGSERNHFCLSVSREAMAGLGLCTGVWLIPDWLQCNLFLPSLHSLTSSKTWQIMGNVPPLLIPK